MKVNEGLHLKRYLALRSEEFNLKESRRYNVNKPSYEKMLSMDHRWMLKEIQNKDGDYIYRKISGGNNLINKSSSIF